MASKSILDTLPASTADEILNNLLEGERPSELRDYFFDLLLKELSKTKSASGKRRMYGLCESMDYFFGELIEYEHNYNKALEVS